MATLPSASSPTTWAPASGWRGRPRPGNRQRVRCSGWRARRAEPTMPRTWSRAYAAPWIHGSVTA